MNKKDLKTYIKLQDEFIHDCNRVAEILKGAVECRDIVYAEKFILDEESVFWSGDEYWSYGGHEYHSGYFDAEYLTMTDEELKAIVEKMNQEYRKEQEQKEKEIEEAERKKRFAEYEELRKEFENNMITEDYVSYETAKLLKEKGFEDDFCHTAYIKPMTSKPSEQDYYQCESSKYEKACETAIQYYLENFDF